MTTTWEVWIRHETFGLECRQSYARSGGYGWMPTVHGEVQLSLVAS
jgi:hypothetical protein